MATSSPELPSSLRALYRSLRLGFRSEPLLLVVGGLSAIAAAVPDALFALGFRFLVEAAIDSDGRSIVAAAGLLAFLAAGTWLLSVASDRANLRLAERAAVPIESYVARLQSSVATVDHQERTAYLDLLELLRDHAGTLSLLYRSLFVVVGSVVRLAVTVGLLMSVHPALGLLAVFVVPNVLVSVRRAAVEKRVEEAGAPHRRRARHWFAIGSAAGAGKEVRVSGVQERLMTDRRASWNRSYTALARARWVTTAWQCAVRALFAAAFVGSVAAVVSAPGDPPAKAGAAALVLAAASRLSQYIGQTVNETQFLRGIWLDASRRLTWLEDYAGGFETRADLEVPATLTRGIRLEQVSFRYPDSDRPVLDDVTLELPAGSVVALVGENGAGKSTLVKLLCRFYEPTAGQITVDGADLARLPVRQWRARLSGTFQDFYAFEFLARQSVGIGDLTRLDDPAAIDAAVRRAGAESAIERLPAGLDTQLGRSWRDGAELSHGQWQRLALARGFMREDPLLLVLDEPSSALDAQTEHALFGRYAAVARDQRRRRAGHITLLVSHRFSTLRMADLIVVLDGARVIETGSHQELMDRNGRYAELYALQADAYR